MSVNAQNLPQDCVAPLSTFLLAAIGWTFKLQPFLESRVSEMTLNGEAMFDSKIGAGNICDPIHESPHR